MITRDVNPIISRCSSIGSKTRCGESKNLKSTLTKRPDMRLDSSVDSDHAEGDGTNFINGLFEGIPSLGCYLICTQYLIGK